MLPKEPKSLSFGDFTLDTNEKILIGPAGRISLTPKSYELLHLFLQNPGHLISKEEIFEQVWGERIVEESNITYTIRQIRKILGDNIKAPKYIQTVPKQGYRFIAAVSFSEPELLPKTSGEAPSESQISPSLQNINPPRENEILTNRKSKKRNSLYIALTLIALATIFLCASWYFLKISKSQREFGSGIPTKIVKVTSSGISRRSAISPDGNLIAYVMQVNGNDSIWLRRLDTNTNTQIYPPVNFVIRRMRFSNDAKSLFFIQGNPGGPSDIFSLDLESGSTQKIASKVEDVLAVARDRKQIGYVRMSDSSQNWELVAANYDGTGATVMATQLLKEPIWAAAWSNNSLSFASGESRTGQANVSLFDVDSESRKISILSEKKWFQVKEMSWMPNDSNLLLSARESLSNPIEIWRYLAPNTEFQKLPFDSKDYIEFSLTNDGNTMLGTRSQPEYQIGVIDSKGQKGNPKPIVAGYRGVDWSNATDKIAYSSAASGNDDIWIMNSDGSEQVQLTSASSTEFLPRFSPDGKSIVYVSDSSGVLHIWQMNADGSNSKQLTNGNGELSPNLSPDGKWLTYHTADDLKLWKMSMERGTSEVLERDALRSEISPDSKMIVSLHPKNANEPKSTFRVVNFETGNLISEFQIVGDSMNAWRIIWKGDSSGFYYASLKNGEGANLHFQPLNSAQAEKLTNFEKDSIFDFDLSPDGNRFVVVFGNTNQSVILINNFS